MTPKTEAINLLEELGIVLFCRCDWPDHNIKDKALYQVQINQIVRAIPFNGIG